MSEGFAVQKFFSHVCVPAYMAILPLKELTRHQVFQKQVGSGGVSKK